MKAMLCKPLLVAAAVFTCDAVVRADPMIAAWSYGPPRSLDELEPAPPPTIDDLLAAAAFMPMCFPADISADELQRIIDQWGLRPPAMLHDHPAPRYFTDTVVWAFGGGLGPAGQATRAHLRYSFPDDGVQWGLASIHAPSVGPNDLNARLVNTFGDLDRGREYIRQALAAWSRAGGLTYTEVPDDNAPMDDFEFHVPTRGDIRIGGAPASGAGFLAYNAFPSSTGLFNLVGGGDMFIATNNFNILNFNNPSNNYRLFRNTVAHEHGHGLGMLHVVPCTQTKLMEPQVSTTFDALTVDEMRGAGRNYGDRLAGNQTLADAHQLGDMTLPVRSVLLRNLSLNGAAGPFNTHTDWFQFRFSSPQQLAVIAVPTGGTYDNGLQSSGCTGPQTSVAASMAGDILLELMNLNTGVSQIVNNNGGGGSETLIEPLLAPGDYALRVTDVGPNPNANQIVQLYDLGFIVGTAQYGPTAVAGIDKRCKGNEPCWFIGRINSHSNAPGASIQVYEWDIDGDGATDIVDPTGEVPFVYPSSGVYDVRLRVLDQIGIDEHTIQVTVHDSQILFSAMAPNSAYRGQTVTAIVDGANFNLPSSFTLSGSGWGASPLMSIHPLGLQAQTTIQIDPLATPGLRDVRITNADGVITITDAFEILLCDGDTNGDGVVDFADFSAVLAAYGTCAGDPAYNPAADLNNDGCVNFTDFSIVLANYGQVCF